MELYVNSNTDYSIRDEKGKKYTLQEAKELWESGKVADCNLSFQRLATFMNFDIEALKKFYTEIDRVV